MADAAYGPVEEAELVTAAVADLQERNPGAIVERVEIVDLKEIEARGMTCDRCGGPITVCYFIKLCDDCIERVGRRG